jgi:hypothetical protein
MFRAGIRLPGFPQHPFNHEARVRRGLVALSSSHGRSGGEVEIVGVREKPMDEGRPGIWNA